MSEVEFEEKYSRLKMSLGPEAARRLQNARVLIVGMGGVGAELGMLTVGHFPII
jgi:tRNA A37 threonylcarbamoyladenosine dehydratase